MSNKKANFEGVEMSHLSLFMLILGSAQNNCKDDDFFYAFVKYIREGNEIDTAIHLAELEIDHDG